jgi:hypothetical protein
MTIAALLVGLVFYAIMQLWLTGHLSPFYRDRTPTYISLAFGAIWTIPLYWFWGRTWRGMKKRVRLDMSRAVVHPRED